ncbi:hypothetical protein [Streptomyces sp. NPDC001816]|uniref:hypothetical protein n=1 Tax=Streptomyces sp. NPDC001816 TaxID=3364612 RepID=UPI0036BC8139
MPGLTVSMEPIPTGTAKFDLFFNLAPDESDGSVMGEIECATDLFDRSTVEQIAARFVRVVEQVVADPSIRTGGAFPTAGPSTTRGITSSTRTWSRVPA